MKYFITGKVTGKHHDVPMLAIYPLGNVIEIKNPLDVLIEVQDFLTDHIIKDFKIYSLELTSMIEIKEDRLLSDTANFDLIKK